MMGRWLEEEPKKDGTLKVAKELESGR